MGARGPLPQSAQILQLRGNPGKRAPRKTVKAPPGAPVVPSWLGVEAKAEWKRVVPALEQLGILARVDRAVLTAYCDAWGKFTVASRALEAEGLMSGRTDRSDRPAKSPIWQVYRESAALVAQLAKEIGATPATRLRMTLPEAPDDDDEGAGILD